MNEWVHKFGVWVVGTLMAGNLFFIRGLVDSIEQSSAAVYQLQSQVSNLQESTKGMMELRIDVAILKSNLNELKQAINKRGNQ